jgi:hypothetical protein
MGSRRTDLCSQVPVIRNDISNPALPESKTTRTIEEVNCTEIKTQMIIAHRKKQRGEL